MYLSLSTKQDRGPLGFLKITKTLYKTQDHERSSHKSHNTLSYGGFPGVDKMSWGTPCPLTFVQLQVSNQNDEGSPNPQVFFLGTLSQSDSI